MEPRDVAQKIRVMRESAGLTQEDLAESAKVALRAIQRAEGLKPNPRLDTILKINKVLRFLFFDKPAAKTVAELTPQEMEALIFNTITSSTHLEVQRLKKENAALKAKISLLPPKLWSFWEKKEGSRVRAAFLYFLLGTDQHIEGKDIPPRLVRLLDELRNLLHP